MTFNHFTRRLHLYLGMFLLPWFFIYGVSSLVFSHPQFFQDAFGKPQWTVRFDRSYDLEVPPGADLKQVGRRILHDNRLGGAFGANRPNSSQVNVYLFNFRSATQLNYFIDQKRLVAKDRKFQWSSFLTGMHARGGFAQDSWLNDAWGITVDIICAGILLWIASGIYMWWKLPRSRPWGVFALTAGWASFLIFLFVL